MSEAIHTGRKFKLQDRFVIDGYAIQATFTGSLGHETVATLNLQYQPVYNQFKKAPVVPNADFTALGSHLTPAAARALSATMFGLAAYPATQVCIYNLCLRGYKMLQKIAGIDTEEEPTPTNEEELLCSM